jgi:hypothetical protein
MATFFVPRNLSNFGLFFTFFASLPPLGLISVGDADKTNPKTVEEIVLEVPADKAIGFV